MESIWYDVNEKEIVINALSGERRVKMPKEVILKEILPRFASTVIPDFNLGESKIIEAHNEFERIWRNDKSFRMPDVLLEDKGLVRVYEDESIDILVGYIREFQVLVFMFLNQYSTQVNYSQTGANSLNELVASFITNLYNDTQQPEKQFYSTLKTFKSGAGAILDRMR